MTHEARFRVYYEDTDMAGVVYHANYLKYVERARSDALREAGVDQRAMLDEGLAFVVTRIEADFVSPARYDDEIAVSTKVTEVRGASATLDQVVRRGGDVLFRALVRFACMSSEGRPVRMPVETKAALAGI